MFLLERAKLVVEGAGAVGVAALLSGRVKPTGGGTTVVVLSGGNVDAGLLAEVARRHETQAGRRLVLLARLSDRPGSLAPLLALVGEHRREPARRPAHPRGDRPARPRDGGPARARDAQPRARRARSRDAVRAARATPRRACRGRRAAWSTSAPITRLSSSASGCHCTPSTNRRSGASIASGRSSSIESPVTSNGSPIGLDPLVVMRLGVVDRPRRRRAPRATLPSGAPRGREPSKLPGCAGARSCPTSSGRCWSSVPPSATFISCMPAADAEHRHVALDRAPCERELGAVALGHRVLGLRMTLGAVGRRVDVVAAGEDQPVDHGRAPRRGLCSSRRRAGSSARARPPAGSRRCS